MSEETPTYEIDPKHLLTRQGKTFIIYAGLLAASHAKGLLSITTDMIQIPTEANNRMAIVKATVTLDQNGVVRQFEAYGDAAPNNTSPNMQTCLVRLAETRAKARAMRDAININVSLEDDPDETDAPERTSAPRQTRQPSVRQPAAPRPQSDPAAPITDAQMEAIKSLCNRRGIPPIAGMATWTQGAASDYIKNLQQGDKAPAGKGANS